MKMMGRKHRPFFRICAVDSRRPRDGRVIEELGTYDPMVPETDARVLLNGERVGYWLGVGAQPSEKVRVLIKKYGPPGHAPGRAASGPRAAGIAQGSARGARAGVRAAAQEGGVRRGRAATGRTGTRGPGAGGRSGGRVTLQ